MAQPTITELVLLLARARNNSQRLAALRHASQSRRFDEDQLKELAGLTDEASRADTNSRAFPLRPLIDPSKEDQNLVPLAAGAPSALSDLVRAELEDWLFGWNHEQELHFQQCAPPGPVLLYGPTGSGKTTTACSIVSQLNSRPAVVLEAHRFCESFLGNTGKSIARAFDVCAKTNSLLVFEEIDALSEARVSTSDGASQENNRITVALMRMIETATFPIIATTNRYDALDAALLRRFEFKIMMEQPVEEHRRTILKNIIGSDPTDLLLSMALNDAIPLAKRLKRQMVYSDVRKNALP